MSAKLALVVVLAFVAGWQARKVLASVTVATGGTAIANIGDAGNIPEVRSLEVGAAITGAGHVNHWTGIFLAQPRGATTKPAQIDRVDYVTFDNGWSIRPDRDRLLLCAPNGSCRPL